MVTLHYNVILCAETKDNHSSLVTPIVIRRISCVTESVQPSSIVFGSDDEMEQDENGEVNAQDDHLSGNGLSNQHEGLGIPVPPAPAVIPNQLGENSIFHTFRSEGGLRDVLTIECQKLNGEDFKGTITYTEATVKIFQQGLGLSTDILHSVKMSFNKFRSIFL